MDAYEDNIVQTERLLKVSEIRYRRLFEAAHDGILILNANTGKITEVNPFMIDLLDYPRAHFIGKELWEIGIFRDKLAHQNAMQELHKNGSIRFENLPLQDHNGQLHPVEIVANIYQEDRESVIQCNIRDIAERVRFEREREALLANEQAARMEAEAANKAKDQFIAVLSHELRTPLTPGLLTLQMMGNDITLSEDQRESLHMIRRNLELEVRLIDDLLDLTMIAKGKMILHMVPVDLHDIQRRVNQICESEIQSKYLKLNVQFHAQQHHVRGDAARLQQILWNLLKNAIKFTPVGGTITIRTENPAKERVALTMMDTGIGINSNVLPRIFNAFEQGESARQFGGLGVGLAISKQITELHGGTLKVHSEGKDKGAAFTMELETCAEEKKVASPPTLFEHHGPQKGGRILLVEDHPDTSHTMSRLLKGFGYQVRIANTVSSALQFAKTERFDAVVSDIGLPDGSGLDLMRQLNGKRLLKGIAVSGYGMEEDIRKSLEAGFSAHLTKPVEMHRLEEVLREICA